MTHRHENEPTMTVQESNAGAGSRWGVQLKKTATRTCSASNTTPRDSRTVQLVKNQRASLRHVSVPRRPQRRRSRSSSMSKKRWRCGGWKTRKASSGSTGTPLLGVALKPFPLKTIQEDEEGDFDFVDLRLLGEPSPEEEVPNGSNFAVRRKPGPRRARARRQSSHSKSSTISSSGSATQKTYQIDLDPDQEWHNGKDKSYLEVKARAIQKEQLLPQEQEQQPQDDELESTSDHMRSLKVTHHPELDKVELELRHVVAPADGGPRKIVTEAVFEVPLCKPVKPLFKAASGEQCDHHEQQEPPELLQISIQNLQSDAVQLVLKQVDPDTREVYYMDNLIDVKLEKHEPPKGWTMAVQLQEATIGDSDRWGNAADNDQALPSSSCHSSNPRRTIVQKRVRFNLGDEDELDEEYDGNGSIHHITLHNSFTPDSLHSKLEISSLSVLEDSADWWESENSKANAPKRPTRCHSPEPGKRCPCRDESCKMPRRTSDHHHDHHDDDVEVVVRDELRVASSHSIPFPTAELIEDDSDSDDDDDSSASSSSDEDSDSDDDEDDDNDMDPSRSRKKELTLQAKRDLLTLYARMGCPTMQQMKDRVAKMATPLEPEDVEMMPWLAGGRFMNVRAMNQLYIDGVNDL